MSDVVLIDRTLLADLRDLAGHSLDVLTRDAAKDAEEVLAETDQLLQLTKPLDAMSTEEKEQEIIRMRTELLEIKRRRG